MTAPRTAPGDGLPLHTSISEREFQSLVVDAANLGGWAIYHTHDSRRSPAGFPDLVLVRDGVLIFAELKRQNGRVSPDQRGWLEQLGEVSSVTAQVWRPSDWPMIERRLLSRTVSDPDEVARRHGAWIAKANGRRRGR